MLLVLKPFFIMSIRRWGDAWSDGSDPRRPLLRHAAPVATEVQGRMPRIIVVCHPYFSVLESGSLTWEAFVTDIVPRYARVVSKFHMLLIPSFVLQIHPGLSPRRSQ